MPGTSVLGGAAEQIGGTAHIGDGMSEVGGIPDVNRTWPSGPIIAEAVEELLKKLFSAEIGEHCQITEFLNY